MQGATPELAREILERAQTPNAVQERVQNENLTARNGQWRRIDHRDVPDFPILDLDYLKHLTIGVYQINLAPGYVQDTVLRNNDDELQLDEHVTTPGFIRVRVYSRYRARTRHQLFIAYRILDDNQEDDEDDLIDGYYCTCQTGARTLGCCAHVACIFWFLGYARHEENIKYPDSSLLNHTLDAANREVINQINDGVEVIEDE